MVSFWFTNGFLFILIEGTGWWIYTIPGYESSHWYPYKGLSSCSTQSSKKPTCWNSIPDNLLIGFLLSFYVILIWVLCFQFSGQYGGAVKGIDQMVIEYLQQPLCLWVIIISILFLVFFSCASLLFPSKCMNWHGMPGADF